MGVPLMFILDLEDLLQQPNINTENINKGRLLHSHLGLQHGTACLEL